jgi:hypothetical protein
VFLRSVTRCTCPAPSFAEPLVKPVDDQFPTITPQAGIEAPLKSYRGGSCPVDATVLAALSTRALGR